MGEHQHSRSIDTDHARRIAVSAQGLDPEARIGVVETIARTGLVRTLGGAEAYLALRARVPGMTRAELDAAVEALGLRVLPAARGCIYLVPDTMTADVLRVADCLGRARAAREHEKAGIRAGELESVADAVVAILARGDALTTSGIRKELPEDVVRALGDAGKKVGISSTLPPALRLLEFSGRIERLLAGGRLDSERYRWRIPATSPFEGVDACLDSEPEARLGDVYFRAAGIATVRSFATWLGVSQRKARAATTRLPLVSVRVDGWPDDGLVHEAHAELLEGAPDPQGLALLPFEDNLLALHGGPASLVDPAFHGLQIPVWGRGHGSTLGDVRHASVRTIVHRDRIIGAWELDPDTGRVIWGTFAAASAGDRSRIEALAEDTARFLNDEIGHGRTFAIDNEKRMRGRGEYVRSLAEGM